MWPASAAFIAGAPPWNGTWVAGTLASAFKKYSVAMCEPLPAPALPKLIGLPCIALRNSPILLTCMVGGTESDSGLEAAIATLVKSSAVKPLFLCSVSLIASAVVVTRTV